MPSEVAYFVNFLRKFFSYETTLKIKDSITFSSGIIIGLIAAFFFICHIVIYANIQWREFDLHDDIVAVKFNKDGYTATFIDPPKTFLGTFNVLIALSILRFNHKDAVSLKDLRKTKKILGIIIIFAAFLAFIGVSFVLSPYLL